MDEWANVDQKIEKEKVNQALKRLGMVGGSWKEKTSVQIKLESEEWAWVQKEFGVDSGDTQLPMCVIVTSHNNKEDLRMVWNAESILQQDYSNYRVVFIDDSSSDGSWQILNDYLRWKKLDSDKVKFFRTKSQMHDM